MSGRPLRAVALLAAFAWPVSAADPTLTDGTLARRTATDPAPVARAMGAGGAEWLGWSVRAVGDAAEICCHSRGFRQTGCSLGERRGASGSRREGEAGTAPTDLMLFAEIARGEVRRLELAGPRCPVDAAGQRVVWLESVDPESSVAFLAGVAERRGGELASLALGAVAYHATPTADRFLARVARDPQAPEASREAALFWSGNLRGDAGYALLDDVLASAAEGSLREHAIFALTLSSSTEALPRIRRAAREDRDDEVRSQALFWLGQSGDPRAAGWIRAAIAEDPDGDVREHGVFALAQLDEGAAELARLLRETDDGEVRRQALFWLGQSDDPRALAALEEVLGAR